MRKRNVRMVFALVLLLCVGSPAWALIAGFNADIHMDIDGVIANDFHIEGRIKSGLSGGGWSVGSIGASSEALKFRSSLKAVLI